MFFKQSLEIMAHPHSEQSGLIVPVSFCLGNEASFPQALGTSSLRERERENWGRRGQAGRVQPPGDQGALPRVGPGGQAGLPLSQMCSERSGEVAPYEALCLYT